MKTLSLAAFVGCILAIGVAIQFHEYEEGEQHNSDLRETEDLPFLRKAEGKYVLDTDVEILDGNKIDDDYDDDNAKINDDDADDDGDDDKNTSLNEQDVETKTNHASQLKSLSDPRRRIRIRPRVMRQVRRFVRKPLMARRFRTTPHPRRKGQKGH